MTRPWLDLWLLALPPRVAADRLARWSSVLSTSERARAARYVQPHRAAQAIAGRALLRHALSFRLKARPTDWPIAEDENGRPHLEQLKVSVDFNIAHTDGMVVAALSSGFAVGVDVEHVTRAREMAEIQARFVSQTEQAHLNTMSPEKADGARVQLWTLKEAWAKARGLGMQLDFTTASFEIAPAHAIALQNDDTWRFMSRKETSGHVVSVAWQDTSAVSPVWRDGTVLLDATKRLRSDP